MKNLLFDVLEEPTVNLKDLISGFEKLYSKDIVSWNLEKVDKLKEEINGCSNI